MNKKIFITNYIICFFIFFNCVSCNRKPQPIPLFPETLPHLHLIRLLKGDKAIAEVNRLHGKAIPVKKAWVAYYRGSYLQGNWREATIWVSEAADISEAQNQTEVMMKKIKNNPKSPFHHFKTKKTNGIIVYIFWGLGQEHAVFSNKTLVYWITATADVFDEVLEYYLKADFPTSRR